MITTKHVFHDTNHLVYPQTRRTVYKKGGMSSETSASPREPLYERGRSRTSKSNITKKMGRDVYEKYLVQEVTMAYSSGHGSTGSGGLLTTSEENFKNLSTPLKVQVAHEPQKYRRRYSSGSLRDYIQDYDSRVRAAESDRSYYRSNETDFPVIRNYSADFIENNRYAGGQGYPIPVQISTSPESDAKRWRRRAASSLGSLITETTTEEYHTFSTRRSVEDMLDAASTPSVHALRHQFEQTAQRERMESGRGSAGVPSSRQSPASGTNIVVVPARSTTEMRDEHGTYRMIPSPDARVRRIERPSYSPDDQRTVLSTTVVDIDPNTGRRERDTGRRFLEETFTEEFRTVKTYKSPKRRPEGQETAIRIPVTIHDTASREHQSRGTSGQIIRETIREDIYVTRSSSSPQPPARSPPPQGQVLRTITTFDGKRQRAMSPPTVTEADMEARRRAASRESMRETVEEEMMRAQMERERSRATEKVSEWRTEETASPPLRSPPPPRIAEELTTSDVTTTVTHIVRARSPYDGTHTAREVSTLSPTRELEPIRRIDESEEEEEEEERRRVERIREEERRAQELIQIRIREEKEREMRAAQDVADRQARLDREQRDAEERQRRIEKERREVEALEAKAALEQAEFDARRKKMADDMKAREEELRKREEERRYSEKDRIERESRAIRERMARIEEERIQREQMQTETEEKRKREREERERLHKEEQERRLVDAKSRKEKEDADRLREKEDREKRDVEARIRREENDRIIREARFTVEEETTNRWARRPAVETLTRESDLGSPSITARPMELPEYRSTISSRPGFNRSGMSTYSASSTTSYGSPLSGTRTLKIVNEMGSSTLSGMSPYGQHAASSIRDAREREKKEMSDLNDRLANYIEKVRFLEAQNRKLGGDLDMLRGRWGKDTSSMRVMYESELKEARNLIDETHRTRADLEAQIKKAIDELSEYRRKYEEALRVREADRVLLDELLEKLSKLEAELNMLKRKIAHLEEDVVRIKKENHRLIGELQRARNELDQETLNRIDHQNQVQTLLEEIDFVRRVHDQEIKELQSMVSRDTTPENREFFKNELASAIRDIRQEYDQRMNSNRTDIESWYKLKVQEIATASNRQTMEHGYQKEEIRRLRTQLSDLRGKLADLEGRNALLEKQTQELNYQLEDDQRSYEAALNDRDASIRKMREECQALMVELQMLLDTKQTLDAEIAIYRKMLEGEENRAGLRHLVEQVVKTHGISQSDEHESMRVLKGETATRTSFQRSAKGNVSIHETSPDGKFIVIENTHRSKDEPIGDWKLKRKIDGKKEIVFTFPTDFVLHPSKNVKVFAHGHGINSPPESLVIDSEESWGTGHNVHTILFNAAGEERATHIQRSSHS